MYMPDIMENVTTDMSVIFASPGIGTPSVAFSPKDSLSVVPSYSHGMQFAGGGDQRGSASIHSAQHPIASDSISARRSTVNSIPSLSDFQHAIESVAAPNACLTDTAIRAIITYLARQNSNPSRLVYPEMPSLLFLRQEFVAQREANQTDIMALVNHVRYLYAQCILSTVRHLYIPVYDAIRNHYCLLYIHQDGNRRVMFYIDSVASATHSRGDAAYYNLNVRDVVEPIRIVLDEADRRKGQEVSSVYVFGSRLLHLASQTDAFSCGLFVCEYARRLFGNENAADPVSVLQPVTGNLIALRTDLCAILELCREQLYPTTSVNSAELMYSRVREDRLIQMAMPSTSATRTSSAKSPAAAVRFDPIKKTRDRPCPVAATTGPSSNTASTPLPVNSFPARVRISAESTKTKNTVKADRVAAKKQRQRARKHSAVDNIDSVAECAPTVSDNTTENTFYSRVDTPRLSKRSKLDRDAQKKRKRRSQNQPELISSREKPAEQQGVLQPAIEPEKRSLLPAPYTPKQSTSDRRMATERDRLDSTRCKTLRGRHRDSAKKRRRSTMPDYQLDSPSCNISDFSGAHTPDETHRKIGKRTKFVEDVMPLPEPETVPAAAPEAVPTSEAEAVPTAEAEAVSPESRMADASCASYAVAQRLEKFNRKISNRPVFPCCVCHQLNFAASVRKISAEDERRRTYGHPHPLLEGPGHICKTCANSIANNSIPKLAARRINLPEVPNELKDLGRMERTLIALRIPFMTIRSLPRGGQVSLKGNFVNIPVALEKSVHEIPRNLASTETVVVKLKRKRAYKSHYIHEVVRAEKVFKAAEFLVRHSPLYLEEGAQLAQDWTEDAVLPPCDVQLTEAEDAAQAATASLAHDQPDGHTDPPAENVGSTSPIPDDQRGDESDDAWEEEVPVTEVQIPPAETVVVQAGLDDTPAWDIVIAPGEGVSPTSMFADRNTMAKAFPTIFGGQPMPNIEELNISWSKFSKWLLGHVDRRTPLTVESIFFLFKVVQIMQLKSAVQVAMRRGNAKGRVTVSQLLSPDGLEAFVRSDDGYKVLSHIRASPSYWQGVQKEVFAMVRQLGKPAFFMSFSSAETRWGALLQSLSETVDRTSISPEESVQLSWETKSRLIRSDPDTCVRYFHSRWEALMSVYLRRGQKGPVGTVEDYVFRVEFQQRGSPHIHSLWWVKDAPKVDDDTDAAVVCFVDSHVSCAMENCDGLPVSYQSHRHAKTCKIRKGGRRGCRFGFPKPPMRTTRILRPLAHGEENKTHSDNWNNILILLNGLWKEPRDMAFDDFLSELKMTEETYLLAIRSSLNRIEVFLKRKTTEIRINAYNKELLSAWQANMDIQYVVNAYATARYIVTYMLKGQRGISNTMKNVVKEVQEGNMSLWTRLRKVANTFLNCVEVSEQEAVWMIRQFPLYRCSRDVIFVSACPLQDRVVLLKPIRELQQLKASDASSCEVESDNVIKRYQRRPAILESMCLATFATWYDCVKPRPASTSEVGAESDDGDTADVETGTLSGLIDNCAVEEAVDAQVDGNESQVTVGPLSVKFEGDKILKRRTFSKVLRSPRFWVKKEKDKHFFENLMLYLPWRDENADLSVGTFPSLEDKWQDALRRNPSIFAVMHKYDKMGFLLDAIIEDVRQEDLTTSDAAVGGNAQHINEIDEAVAADTAGHADEEVETVDMLADAGLPPSSCKMDLCSRVVEDPVYKNLACCLNSEQKRLFYDIIYQVKFISAPLRLFVTGGAGVGKSYLLRALYQYFLRYYRQSFSAVDPAAENVLIIAPTGKAAHLIAGYTAHNALRIPVNQSLKDYKKVDADKMNTLRHDLRSVRILIIDEISMIGYHILRFIDRRLRDLTDVQSRSFGGLHVLCFGDLFQLRPVKDSYVFQTPANSYEALTDTLWHEFTMYELKTIMRQKEDLQYAHLLNRLREGLQTPADIAALEQRVVSNAEVANIISSGTVCVCRTNARADLLNDSRLESISTLKQTFFAIDRKGDGEEADALCSKPDSRFTGGLPGVITVAVGMRIELTINIDTADGLTNGASGIVQGFSKKDNRFYWSQDIIWIAFDEEAVGARRRQQLRYAFNSPVEVDANDRHRAPLPVWTPIVREVRPVSITRRSSIDRLQMPIRLAAAKTIHRSQGDSYSTVLADFSGSSNYGSTNHMHYVALSRVKSAMGLSIVDLVPKKISTDPAVKGEMKRLRTLPACRFNFALPHLRSNPDSIRILFHNITSLRTNFKYAKEEDSLHCCDALIFAEARVTSNESQSFALKGFNTPSLPSVLCTRYGLAVYTRSSLAQWAISRVGSDDLSIELVVLRHLGIAVVALYRSPSSDMRQFTHLLQSTLGSLPPTAFIALVGDFNIDVSGPAFQTLHDVVSRFGLRLVQTAPTTDAGTFIDKIYVNNSSILGHVLQTYYSFHSPLIVFLPAE